MVINPNEILDMLLALPEDKQEKAKSYIEKLVREWDPDFVKLTPAEKVELEKIENENEYFTDDQIDWDK